MSNEVTAEPMPVNDGEIKTVLERLDWKSDRQVVERMAYWLRAKDAHLKSLHALLRDARRESMTTGEVEPAVAQNSLASGSGVARAADNSGIFLEHEIKNVISDADYRGVTFPHADLLARAGFVISRLKRQLSESDALLILGWDLDDAERHGGDIGRAAGEVRARHKDRPNMSLRG